MCTYEAKKASSLERKIDFDLTPEEFSILQKVIKDPTSRCPYTGLSFIHKHGHRQQPTIERMDGRYGGYTKTNCIIVTRYANQLKDCIERGEDVSKMKLKSHEDGLYRHIKHVTTQDNWKENLWNKQIGKYYKEDYAFYIEELNNREVSPQEELHTPLEAIESNTEELQEQTGTLTLEKEEMQQNQTKEVLDKAHPLQETTEEVYKLEAKLLKDLFISTYFNHLINHAIKNKIIFSITLSQFRGLILKKTCSLSSDVLLFSEEVSTQPKLLLKDTSAGYVLGNVIVVSGKTQELVGKAREVFGKDLSEATKILSNLKSL